MKLENDRIVIESRSEISLLQDMIEKYVKSEKMDESDKQGLEKIKEQLDGLWYSW